MIWGINVAIIRGYKDDLTDPIRADWIIARIMDQALKSESSAPRIKDRVKNNSCRSLLITVERMSASDVRVGASAKARAGRQM